jgi:hypothetical protein
LNRLPERLASVQAVIYLIFNESDKSDFQILGPGRYPSANPIIVPKWNVRFIQSIQLGRAAAVLSAEFAVCLYSGPARPRPYQASR